MGEQGAGRRWGKLEHKYKPRSTRAKGRVCRAADENTAQTSLGPSGRGPWPWAWSGERAAGPAPASGKGPVSGGSKTRRAWKTAMHVYDTFRREGHLRTPAVQFTPGTVIFKSVLERYFMCNKTHQPQADRSLCSEEGRPQCRRHTVGKRALPQPHGPRALTASPRQRLPPASSPSATLSGLTQESQRAPSCLASAISVKRSVLLPPSQASLCDSSTHHSPADRGVGLRSRGSYGRCVLNVVRSCPATSRWPLGCAPSNHLSEQWPRWRSHRHTLMTRRASVHLLNIPENACSNAPHLFWLGCIFLLCRPLQILATGSLPETHSVPFPQPLAFYALH